MPLLAGKGKVGHNIREMQRAGHPHEQAVAAALHKANDAGAGVLLTHDDRALFLKRSDDGAHDHPGEWCCPGGSVEAGETPEQAARREFTEETGLTGLLTGDFTRVDEGDGFVTFRQNIGDEPTPTLNSEHIEARWAPLADPPQPLHPGVTATLKKLLGGEVMDAEWNESDHPRSEEGEFASTPGGKTEYVSSPTNNPTNMKPHREARAKAWEHANFLKGKGHEDVRVTKRDSLFTVPVSGRGQSFSTTFTVHHGQPKSGAQDRREYDDNGWFEVFDNPISSVGVYEYSEASVVEGGDPRKMVGVFRPPEELDNPETINSFRLMPWTDDHPSALLGSESKGLVPAEKKGVHGVIGEKVYFKHPTLYGNLKVFSESLKGKIPSKRELSCGYHCTFVPQDGVYEGKPYQYVQKNIRGNHVSSVDAGRMGAGVRVMDAAEYFTFALDMRVRVDPNWKETMRDDEQRDCLDADTLKFIEDSFGSLVGELERKGYSKAYATKVAGKVAAEKGDAGHHQSTDGDTTVAEKTEAELKRESEDRKAARDSKRSGLDAARAKDGMTSEEEEACDTAEAACDAEEDEDDKKDESKDARDRKSARDRRAGARDARKGTRDKKAAKDTKDVKDAADKAARDAAAKGKGMDAAEVETLVERKVNERVEARVAAIGPTLRKEEAAKNGLYARLSPIIGAFDAAEMTLPAMATYGLKKLGVTAEASDPVTALDFLLVGRAQAAPAPGVRAFAQDAAAGTTSVDGFFASL